MHTPVIAAQELTKSFGDLTAVKGISFTVQGGECFGLLGPNGAGKSTTVKMIHGLSPLTSGNLEVFGMNITTSPRTIKSRLGLVSQEDNLDPELTVLENLIVFAGYFRMKKEDALKRAAYLLSFMELEEKTHTRVDNLSGGMKRRLTIARALINSPDLIILDEPTTGLDPHARHSVWQKIRELKEKGTTVLLTTHYLEEASQLCDRLVFIHHGKIIDEGKPHELIISRVGQQVLELAGGDLDLLLKKIADCPFLKGSQKVGSTLHLYSNEGNRLREAVQSSGLQHSYEHLRPATLEDVFLKLTGHNLGQANQSEDN